MRLGVFRNSVTGYYFRLFLSEKKSFVFPDVWVAKGFPRTSAGAHPELLLSDGRTPVPGLSSKPHYSPPTKMFVSGYSQLCWEITGPQKEVFLVQPWLRWRKLRHHAAPSAQKPTLSFFQICLCCLRMYKVSSPEKS